MPDRTLFVVQYEARPLPGSSASATSTGAYANVWVDASTEAEAVFCAATEIENAGWSPESQPEVALVSRADYEGNPAGLEHFEQALQDGVVVVLHTWREVH